MEIFAYGSFARGDMHEGSDMDLLVIGPFREPPAKRVEHLLDIAWTLKLEIPIEGTPLTPMEWNQVKDRPFFTHIQSEWLRIPESLQNNPG